ncbi:MAG: bifunctional (p)ppGpp synthetase/guanosine-3',5'-bis(diphosphate) 3'-pyrophosphohydrolase [Erysipelotrichaceae bacterium]|nr:bifunctional (p)ppGpp synthetase/guanosine-3',5'-bis(diphosphate) 3'-pyrophosphohydrolase [Erysipelotrichaceae bacterium]
MIEKAKKLCLKAHEGQFDKAGNPYYTHPFFVASLVKTEDEKCVAYLHDVIEDTSYTLEDIAALGFNNEVLRALSLMTHDPHVPYMDYVLEIRQNPIARVVKIADLTHNSDLSRISHVRQIDLDRLRKYRIAKALLNDDEMVDDSYHKIIPLTEHSKLTMVYDTKSKVEFYKLTSAKICYRLTSDQIACLYERIKVPGLSLYECLSNELTHNQDFITNLLVGDN